MTNPSAIKPITSDLLTQEVVTRFHSRYTVAEDGCWEWDHIPTGQAGYGRFHIQRKGYRAHRISYVIASGHDIPDGKYLDHLCRNRSCVNPAHLEPVTHRENIARGEAPSSLAVRTILETGRCQRGHDLSLPGAWKVRGSRRDCRQCQNITGTASARRVRAARDASAS